jgi:DNA segregation ATPase FtsK/SpoIIIE, S-DNA-T family
MKESIVIDRPPRIQPELPVDEIEIPQPPSKDQSGYERLIQVALPMVTIIGYIAVTAFGGAGRSPLMLIPMALSVVASTAFAIYSYRKERQRRAEQERAYNERLVELTREMHGYHDQQRRFFGYNYPGRSSLFRIARNARHEALRPDRSLRAEVRLYERRVEDEDFGVVRLGIGTRPSTVVYTMRDAENFEDRQVREALKLQDDSRFVTDIPIIINLRQTNPDDLDDQDSEEKNGTPVTHALGIAGEPAAAYEFTRSLLAHYTVFHAPMDAKLYLLATRKKEWAWVARLPHSQADEQNQYCCFVEEYAEEQDKNVFEDEKAGGVEHFLEGLRKVLAQRKIRLQDKEEGEGKADPRLPFLLVVVDLMDVVDSTKSPLTDLEADAAISILLEEGTKLGAAVIFLVPERSKVPSGCRSVVEIEQTTPASNSRSQQFLKLHFRYAEVGVNSYRYVGEADHIGQRDHMLALANELAGMEVRQGYGANLTTAVPFLELMGYETLPELLQQSWQWWQESTQSKKANWLRAKIARMSGNKDRTLVFSAKRDGVHGMVAGSTGSGKSELLISLISAMAVTYDPSVVNFVLVDYKGGGAFKGFEELPHCVDIITNLEGDGVTRMFTAINAELQRRQLLNVETNTKNIVDYREKGLHLSRQPYPFLFIIIDEFAEMIADRAEYKAELETITRVGRAQGVSLILAAQRPSGVTDQMRSNIKFRICLRVETPGESREMLRRADASYLPSIPGRGYLQVGNDEIELVQVAYTGDKYANPNHAPPAPVLWPERDQGYNADQDAEALELYRVIVAELARRARTHGLPKQQAPWPDFLPTYLSLSQPLISQDPLIATVTAANYLTDIDAITLGQPADQTLTLNPAVNLWLNGSNGWIRPLDWQQHALRPVIGLVDNPYAARQMPLVVDLRRGHVAAFGSSGGGKTSFIRTLAASLAATHAPDQVHLYILDLGGRNLNVLTALPHVGSVISPDEEGYVERVEQLLRVLDETVEDRKAILSTVDAADIYQYNYNALTPEKALPAIVVAIDNFTEFRETFGQSADNTETTMDRFVALARQSRAYGIHFVVTASQLNVLPNQVFSLFTERMTFKLADPAEYRAIVGGQVSDIGDIPGRGYVKTERMPLAFQLALPFDLSASSGQATSESQELLQFGQNMVDSILHGPVWNLPAPINALPKAILFKQILARQNNLALDSTFLPRLRELTRRKWAESTEPDLTDWLNVTLGVISGDRPRQMHLEAKRDGVHGMIAGGTGSGKSELLMTMVVGLALNYDPSILNFVLVDYKGGGAFKPFERLPHCVDIVTNLNKAAVRRMFTAINAEMQRRQKLNADTGTKDIVEYRKKGLHLSHEPYPHLFIIIDEYAEMITDSPEFRDELDSITRVGRAQGVNLVLASQRPVGVSDQMRANIKFRICLRVEQVDTSREMLRRSDAALLPSGMPGRGYLQVGNEHIELIQMAYTGETFEEADVEADREKPKFYDVVVDLANELLVGERPRTPWPPILPAALTFSTPLVEEYVNENEKPVMNLGRTSQLAVNPFVAQWQAGKGSWPGIDWRRTAMRAVAGLVDDPYEAQLRPLVVDLSRGHGVIFGASGWGKTTFLRSVILSLAATHSPDEFHAHVIDLGGRNLEVLAALPHVGTVIMPDERGYEERVQQLLRELNDIVDHRKRLFSEAGVSTLYEYNGSGDRPIEPAILVTVDNFLEFIETFGNPSAPDERDTILGAFVALARQGKAFGIHFLITAMQLKVLTSKLYSLFTERLSLRLSDANDYSAIVGGQVVEVEEIPGRGYIKVGRQPLAFQIALPPGTVDADGQIIGGDARQIRLIGAEMARYVDGATRTFKAPLRIDALPKASSFRQVLAEVHNLSFDGDFMAQLKMATATVWARNASAQDADWLQVILGITSGNRKRNLQFEAKKDGVHGMIAGGTGSGKSELLMTMIVGLALNYSPDILNFVLVDYKGGGAFKPFERLPHCVDIVTNLNKAGVDRMFTAINAEIRRRQAMNAETGTKDIVDYRRKGLHLTREPYPHLFVIIDEYAEMIDNNPEYRTELESITRVGRAQGVNLMLASQRPKGVTDQMRANIKLRICLRVEELDTSREMLRRPDAALLPNGMPGRGYLQIGNESIELIQVSWTGEGQPDERPPTVLWPDRPALTQTLSGEGIPAFYDAVVELTRDLYGGQMAPKPWPGFLPTQFSLQSELHDAQNNAFVLEPSITDWLNGESEHLWPGVDWQTTAMQPVAGLVDEPSEARQYPLSFDLRRNHLVVLGDAGFGKSTLLRTIIAGLAATHSPNELHVYILDLGGRNFRSLEELPHIGAVIYGDEEAFEERLLRLLEMLNGLLRERQQILSEADATNLYDFNQRSPEQALPAILVVIDNFAELQENYELLVESTLMPLVRSSCSAGIAFVVTANVPNNMASKFYALFGERITFKQSNPDRYMDIVGRGALDIDEISGRGYVKPGREPLLFQIAQPVGIFDANGRNHLLEAEELRSLAHQMRYHLQRREIVWKERPRPIEILPEIVPLRKTLERTAASTTEEIEALLGQNADLQPALFNLERMGPHFAVVGPPISGKTTTLYNWVFSLAERYPPDQVAMVLIDTQRRFMDYGGKRQLSELPHVLATVSEAEELAPLVANLAEEGAALAASDGGHRLFIFIDNFDDFSEELERYRDISRDIATLARRYGRAGLHFVIAGALDSGISELRRRVQASSYGIGLRTAQAVETLRVMRTPSALRGKELPVGRGYTVRSGQTTMIQIATPYDGMDLSQPGESREAEDLRNIQALDLWVERIRAKYGEQQAGWYAPTAMPLNGSSGTATAPTSPHMQRILKILKAGMQWELAVIDREIDSQDLITVQYIQAGAPMLNDERKAMELLRALLHREQRASGLEDDVIQSLYKDMDDESILFQLEGRFLHNGSSSDQ